MQRIAKRRPQDARELAGAEEFEQSVSRRSAGHKLLNLQHIGVGRKLNDRPMLIVRWVQTELA
jgi:hypothetical protein